MPAAVWAGSSPDAAQLAPPPAPTEVGFDPSVMPEPALVTPPLGLRYSDLTPTEAGSLRRGCSLSLDALGRAATVDGLRAAMAVAPLPDPSKPILAVPSATDAKGNPFSADRLTSFRDNPMKALGERLGAGDADLAGGDSIDDAFAVGSEDADEPLDNAAPAGGDTPAEATEDAAADPFSEGADPFSDGQDPFGF